MFSVMMKKLMNRGEEVQNKNLIKDNDKNQELGKSELPYPTGQKAREQELMFPTSVQK